MTQTRSRNVSQASGNDVCSSHDGRESLCWWRMVSEKTQRTYEFSVFEDAHDVVARELCVHDDPHELVEEAVELCTWQNEQGWE